MKKRSAILIGKSICLLVLFCLASVALRAQTIATDIINDNINWEFRITQTRWTAGTTDPLDPDATPFLGSVPEHEPSFLISAAPSTNSTPDQVNSGNICIQWAGVPPTTNNIDQLIKYQPNTPYSGFDVDYRSWEDDGGSRCSVDSGDDDFMRIQKYYNHSISSPSNGLWTVRSESFSNGSSANSKYYWHYSSGNTISDPLDFGTISSSVSHINQNSPPPSDISTPSSFQYTSTYSGTNGQSSRDVFYKFTLNSPQIVTIATNNANTAFDTYIHLLDGNGNHLASNDNTAGTTKSEMEFTPLCKGTYLVVVEGKGSASGTFQLDIMPSFVAPFNGGTVQPQGNYLSEGDPLPPITNFELPATIIDLEYQWESSPSLSGGPWTELPGQTGISLSNYGNFTGCEMGFRRRAYACGNDLVAYSNIHGYIVDHDNITGGEIGAAGSLSGAQGGTLPSINSVSPGGATPVEIYAWQIDEGNGWTIIPGQSGPDLSGTYILDNAPERYRRIAYICGFPYYSNILTFTLYPSATSGGPIHVDAGATGSNNGSSWNNAYTNLQDAIDEAEATGAEIWVAAGTYRPTRDPAGNPGGVFNTFLISANIQIYGGFAGTETMRSQRSLVGNRCILSGDLNNDDQTGLTGAALLDAPSRADNALHVLIFNGLSGEFLLDGFEIRGGNFNNTPGDNIGGGAVWIAGGSSLSAPVVRNCDFYDNASFEFGGAVFHQTSNGMSYPKFFNCNFKNNYAALDGGAVYNDVNKLDGSATANPTFGSCRFEYNSAGRSGGALFNEATNGIGKPYLAGCWFIGNSATLYGGAIENFGSTGEATVILLNAIFIDNTAGSRGGALYNLVNTSGINSEIVNCSFHNNQAGVFGGAIYNVSGNPDVGRLMIFNSILWNNGTQEVIPLRNSGFGTVTMNNSIFDDGTIDNSAPVLPSNFNGSNNLDSDPLFFRPQWADLRITGASPAVNAGDNTAPSVNHISVDMESNSRIIGGTVDIGAYENNCELLGDKILVDSDAPGPGDGQSWGTAFPRLHQGIEAACLCDQPVWVAGGTYYPTVASPLLDAPAGSDNYKKTFYIDRNVQLYGGFAGTETLLTERDHKAHPTILSGNFDESDVDALKVLYLDGTRGRPITPDCIIDGFTIEGGNARFSGFPEADGGGMYNDGGGAGNSCSPTIRRCIFSGNRALLRGGAMYNNGADGGLSAPVISHCYFFNNQAQYGGAMHSRGNSAPQISDCIFEQNHAFVEGGALRNEIIEGEDISIILDCSFIKNTADEFGGAITDYRSVGGGTLVTNSIFAENQANIDGGALQLYSVNTIATPRFVNCLFSGNIAGQSGSAVYTTVQSGEMRPDFVNTTFVGNQTGIGFGGTLFNHVYASAVSEMAITNSILWNGEMEIYNNNGATTSLNHSIIFGGFEGNIFDPPPGVSGSNNIGLDPLFVDAPNGDFRLQPSSPGIDAGDNTAITGFTTDLAGNERIANQAVDMGAYENELPLVSALVTFRVDMSRETVSADGVHVAGNFQSEAGFGSDWDPGATEMTDPDNDQIYEVTVELMNVSLGRPFEYKFINGNAWGPDESVPLDCVVNNLNRQFFLESKDQTLPLVCFGRCLACTEGCRSILDFEDSSTSGDFQYFSNNYLDGQAVPLVANPAPDAVNSSSTVLAFTKTATAPSYAGAFSDLGPDQVLDLSASDQLSVRVWMDHPGNITLKVEASTTGGADWIQTVENDVINQWARLYFDLGQNSLEAPFEPAAGQAYSRLVLFPDFGYSGTDADVVTYFDNFILCANRNGGGGDNCDDIDLTLGDGSLPSGTYRAEISLTSANSIEPGETVVFTAGESIRLTAGFHARPQSSFTAMIADCAPATQSAPLVQSVPAENTLPVSKDPALTVFPNPSRYEATLEFNLADPSPVSLEVYHGTGVLIKRLLDGEVLDPGIYRENLVTGSLESGIYYVVLRTPERKITKKLLVLE